MIPKFRNPDRRIVVALLLSLLAHVLVIWLPHIRFPHFNVPLPALTVQLQPAPKLPPARHATRNVTRKPQPQAAPAPAKVAAPAQILPDSAVSIGKTLAASAVVAIEPASAPLASAAASAPAAAATLAEPDKIPFPKHALLSFAVRNGDDGFRIGEVQHSLDITDNQYIVQSYTRTSGIARWFKSFNLNQTSTGTVSAAGLQPDNFAEEKSDGGNLRAQTAVFDWNTHQLQFSSGESTTLPDGTQDALSILYQLALLNLHAEIVPVNISTGNKLEGYRLEIASNVVIPTPLGDLATVQLRRMRENGKSGLIIWLAKEYRLLPVKIQYLEPDGSIAATISITDIRVSDE